MTKRMLIDSTHAEETRVVVLDGNRLEDYDVETSTKKQLKGNIYLAKVVRVEPSLQAAFVEYGGNRHGFLAFGEIHPDYYQIPVADRQRLMALQEAEAREDEEQEEAESRASHNGAGHRANGAESADTDPVAAPVDPAVEATVQAAYAIQADPEGAEQALPNLGGPPPDDTPASDQVVQAAAVATELRVAPHEAQEEFPAGDPDLLSSQGADMAPEAADSETASDPDQDAGHGMDDIPQEPPPEAIGGGDQASEEARERRPPPRFMRNYKIQEVIHRRQILLIQVVKEERGTKGAALTTYISLAGRYSVLMPNSPRGGGVSRKITSASDRRRLKEVMQELELPRGMGLIIRTAGANRPKPEIMRDGEYLLTQWDQIRDVTMRSTAPALIYEEASLIKRAIRDVYSREVEEVLVDGEDGWRAARDYMRMLMPAHARKVQLWREAQPLFAKQHVDIQLDAMLSPTVQLRSGGYLVINQTEALVAIDVNSGRSTRERGIEETALRTNMEAAEEVARQLRLRDLAGLVVIDFIDMESRRNNAMVERRLKDSLRNDRARIQVGSISHFGLLEMSRQRLRPSISETSSVPCPHCGGTGHVRSTESAALHVLRGIEEEGAKRKSAEILVHVASSCALYILNHKRDRLTEIEARFGMRVAFASDDSLIPPQMRIMSVRAQVPGAALPIAYAPPPPVDDVLLEQDEEIEEADDTETEDAPVAVSRKPEAPEGEGDGERDPARRKRRRRRRSGRRDEAGAEEEGSEPELQADAGQPGTDQAGADHASGEPESAGTDEGTAPPPAGDLFAAGDGTEPASAEPIAAEPATAEAPAASEAAEDEGDKPRRRGRRGGKRRRKGEGEDAGEAPAAETPEPVPAYAGPTPANPFAGQEMDVFEVLEAAEERAALWVERPRPAAIPIAVPDDVPTVEDEPSIAAPAAPSPEHVTVDAAVPEAAPEPVSPDIVAPDPVVPTSNGLAAHPAETPQEPAIAAPEPTMPPAEERPAIAPIVIGSAEAAAAPKRGWWRR